MGHVVNPYLFRLNYTVFWNISIFSKKKFSIFIDLKSLLIYNFFNTFFNSYKNIRRIKLRLLKIKISFYCNTIKIFFFFVKHKNMNKNFKKMFNNFEINYYFFENLKYINNYFWLYSYKNEKTLDQMRNFKIINLDFLDIKQDKKKLREKNLSEFTDHNNTLNDFFFKKKINLLFTKNYKNNLKKINSKYKKKKPLNYFFEKKFNSQSVFDTLNLTKKLIYKNYKKLIQYFYDFELINFKNDQYFKFNNFSLYKNNLKNYHDSKVKNVRRLNRKIKKLKKKKFWKKIKMRKFVYKKINPRIKLERIKLKDYIFDLNEYKDIKQKEYRYKKFKRYEFYKKNFFFINIKKKKEKHNNYFGNNYFSIFFKNKNVKRAYYTNWTSLFNNLPFNLSVSKKKSLSFDKINNNKKKIYMRGRMRRKRIVLINSVNKKKHNKNFNFNRINILKKKKFSLKNILLKKKKIGLINIAKGKKNFLHLVNKNFKNNLKIIYDKYLLFNFIKKFLKLKLYVYNVFNRIYLFNVSSVLTVCLKRYTRWKFTADFLNDLIIVRLKQKFFIKSIMKFIIKYLNKKVTKNKIKGYAILLKGRFSRKDRAVFEWKKRGKTKKTNKMHIIDFSNKSVNLTYSKAAINIWITRSV